MRAGHSSPDVQELLRLLAKHEVRYVVIGGTAVIYHWYARLTGGVDLFYDCRPENAGRLWNALLEFWDGSVPAVEGPKELADRQLVVQFGRPPNRIDLIAGLRSVSFDEAWAARIEESMDTGSSSIPVWILGLEHRRRSKQDAGRPKDLDDLEHLPMPGT